MVTFFSILLAIACIIIIAAVLLQPAKSGVSALGGTSQSIFGSTGGTTFLFRATMILGFFAMAVCLFLSWYKISSSKSSVMDGTSPQLQIEAPLTNPTAPSSENKAAPEQTEAAPAAAPTAPVDAKK